MSGFPDKNNISEMSHQTQAKSSVKTSSQKLQSSVQKIASYLQTAQTPQEAQIERPVPVVQTSPTLDETTVLNY